MVKNVIFDLGNVVLILNFKKLLKEYVNNEEDVNLLNKIIFESDAWKDYDLGLYNKKTLEEKIISDVKRKDLIPIIKKVIRTWTNEKYLVTNRKNIELIKDLKKQGINTYILSNAPYEIPSLVKTRDLKKYFNGNVFSCYFHISKPDERIYDKLLNKYNLNPEECIFLDDNSKNIEAANKKGINAIEYHEENHDKILNILKSYNLNI